MKIDDLMKLPNVTMTQQVRDEVNNASIAHYEVSDLLAKLLIKIVPTNPQWTFKVSGGSVRMRDGVQFYSVERTTVMQDGEELGNLSMYYFRHKWNIGITCRRAKQHLDRGDTLRTSDVDKAASLVKKLFAKQSMAERIQEAKNKAEHTMSQATWIRGQSIKTEYDKFQPAMLEFVLTEAAAHFETFVEEGRWPMAKNALSKYKELQEDQRVVKDISSRHKSGKTCLTLLGDGKYVVQIRNEPTQVFDDATLPDELRGRLGLLKLVSDGQMVDNVGCRISESVFVIVNE